ncbi:MAG: hypothetical protein WC119_01005 [Synergistaceae bacterium]
MSTQFIAKPRDNMDMVFSAPSKPSLVCGIRCVTRSNKHIVSIPFSSYKQGDYKTANNIRMYGVRTPEHSKVMGPFDGVMDAFDDIPKKIVKNNILKNFQN